MASPTGVIIDAGKKPLAQFASKPIKYKTVAFDSASDLSRLFFSKDMGKGPNDMETIRGMSNYPGTTERLNMLVRRCKNLRDRGVEVVFTAHEDIQKVYGRGGAMAKKGERPQEPIAVKGWPDMPGQRTPDEFCRACDNVLRMRYESGKTVWVGRRESLAGGTDYWEVKDRFNAQAERAGFLPSSYSALAEAVKRNPLCNWEPPYIWMIYGSFGIGKTRSLLTFPRPLLLFNLDHGTKSISKEIAEDPTGIEVIDDIDPEDANSYDTFIKHFGNLF